MNQLSNELALTCLQGNDSIRLGSTVGYKPNLFASLRRNLCKETFYRFSRLCVAALIAHRLAHSLRTIRNSARNQILESVETIVMNEFLLLALIIVYVVICYRPTSTQAQGDQQNRHNEKASYKARGNDDH